MPFGWPSGQRDGAIAEYSSARPAPSPGGGHTPGHVLAGLLVQALGLLAERHRYGPRLLDRAGLIGQPARSAWKRARQPPHLPPGRSAAQRPSPAPAAARGPRARLLTQADQLAGAVQIRRVRRDPILVPTP